MIKKLIDWIWHEDNEKTYIILMDYSGDTYVCRVKYNDWDEPFVVDQSLLKNKHFLCANGLAKRKEYNFLDGKWKHKSGPEVRFPNAN